MKFVQPYSMTLIYINMFIATMFPAWTVTQLSAQCSDTKHFQFKIYIQQFTSKKEKPAYKLTWKTQI